MKKGKTTSFDIAHLAGVSQSTVSRALRDSALVQKETRDRIKQIAKELNYKVDKNATNLRTQRSGTIALLLFEDSDTDTSQINPFFIAMLSSITRASAKQGLDLLVSFQKLDDDWHAEYEDSHKADGLILLGYGDYLSYEAKLQQLANAGANFVLWGPQLDSELGSSISCDNRSGARMAVDHLLERGRKNIAFIGDTSEDCPEFYERLLGYQDALHAQNIAPKETLHISTTNTDDAGILAVEKLEASGQFYDAIFCSSDLIAIGAIKALQKIGKRIPEDISIVGFDNIPAASLVNPALTTINQNAERAGELLVEQLLKRVAEEKPESLIIPAQLIVRESS